MASGSANSISAANALASVTDETVALTAALSGTIDLLDGTDTLNLGRFASVVNVRNVERVIGAAGVQTVTFLTDISGGLVSLGDGADVLDLNTVTATLTVRDVETITATTGDQNVTFGSAVTGATVALGAGADRVNFGAFASTATVSGVETIIGGAGAQVITLGDAVTTAVRLGDGADTLNIGNFATRATVTDVETVNGGTGAQTVIFASAVSGAVVDLGAGTDSVNFGNFASSATVSNVETIVGGDGDQFITLGSALVGGAVRLGDGEDTLSLGSFTSRVTVTDVENVLGDAGAQTIVYAAAITDANVNLGAGSDSVNFGAFASTALVSSVETVLGGAGDQAITLGSTTTNMAVRLGDGDDSLDLSFFNATVFTTDVETITGSNADHTVILRTAADSIDLGGGTDEVRAGATLDLTETTLAGIETFVVLEGFTLTINGADVSGKTVTGAGNLAVVNLEEDTDLSGVAVTGTFTAAINIAGDVFFTGDFGGAAVTIAGAGTLHADLETLLDTAGVDGGSTASVNVTGLTATSDLTTLDLTDIDTLTAEIDTDGDVTFTGNFAETAVALTGSGTLTGSLTTLLTAASLDGGGVASLTVTDLTGTSDLTALGVSNMDTYTATLVVTGGVTFTGDFDGAAVELIGTGTLTGDIADLNTASSVDGGGTASLAVTDFAADSDLGAFTNFLAFDVSLDVTGDLTFTGDFGTADVTLTGTGTLTAPADAIDNTSSIDGSGTASLVIVLDTDSDLSDLTLDNFADIEAVLETDGDPVTFTGDLGGIDLVISGAGEVTATYAVLDTTNSVDAAGAEVVVTNVPRNVDLGFISGHTALSATVVLTADVLFIGDFNDADVSFSGTGVFSSTRSRLSSAGSIDANNDEGVIFNITGINGTTDLTTLDIQNLVTGNLRGTISTGVAGNITVTTANYAGAALIVAGTGTLNGTIALLETANTIDASGTARIVVTALDADSDLSFITNFADLDATLSTTGDVTFTGDFGGADVTLSGSDILTGSFAVLSTAEGIDGANTASVSVTDLTATSDLTDLGLTQIVDLTASIDTEDDVTFTGDFADADVTVTGSGLLTLSVTTLGTATSLTASAGADLTITDLVADTDLTDFNISGFDDVTATLDTDGDVTFTGDFDGALVELIGVGTLSGDFAVLSTSVGIDGGDTASLDVTGLGATSQLSTLGYVNRGGFTASLDTTGDLTFTGDFDEALVTLLGDGTLTLSFTLADGADGIDGSGTASVIVTGLVAASDVTDLAITNVDALTAQIDTTGNITFTGDFGGAAVDLAGTGVLTGDFAVLGTGISFDGGILAGLAVTGLTATSDLTTLDTSDLASFDASLAQTANTTFTGDFAGADVTVTGAFTLSGSFAVLDTAASIDGSAAAALDVSDLADDADLTQFTNFTAITASIDVADAVTFTGDFNNAVVTASGDDTLTGSLVDLVTAASLDGNTTVSLSVTDLTATSDLSTLNASDFVTVAASLDTGSGVTFTGDFDEAAVTLLGTNTLTGDIDDLATAASLDGGGTASVSVTGLVAASDLTTLGIDDVVDLLASISVSSAVTFTGNFGTAAVTLLGSDTLSGDFADIVTASAYDGDSDASLNVTGLTATSDLSLFTTTGLVDYTASLVLTADTTFTGDFGGADVTVSGVFALTGSFDALTSAASLDGSTEVALVVTDLTATSDLNDLNVTGITDLDATISTTGGVTFTGDFTDADVILLGTNTLTGSLTDLNTGGSYTADTTAALLVTGLVAASDLTTLNADADLDLQATLDVTGGLIFTGDFAGAEVTLEGGATLTGSFADLDTADVIDGDTTSSVAVTGLTATSDLSDLGTVDLASFTAEISTTGNVTFTGDFDGAAVTMTGAGTLTGDFATLADADGIDGSGTASLTVTDLTATSDLSTLGYTNRADFVAELDTATDITFTGDFDDAAVSLTGAGVVSASFAVFDTATAIDGGGVGSLQVTGLVAASDLSTLAVTNMVQSLATLDVTDGVTFTGDFDEFAVTLIGSDTLTADVADLVTADTITSQTTDGASVVVTGLTAASDLSLVTVDRDGAGAVAAYSGTLDVGSDATVTGTFTGIDLTLTGSNTLTGDVDDLLVANSITSSTGADVTVTGLGQDQAGTDYDSITLGATGTLTLTYDTASTYADDGVATIQGNLGETDAIVVTTGDVAVTANTLATAATANGSDAIAVTGDIRVIIDADNEGDDLNFITHSGGTLTLVTTGEVVFQGDVGDATVLETTTDSAVSFAASALIESGLTSVGGDGTLDTVLTFADNRADFSAITSTFADATDFRALVVTNLTISNAAFDFGDIGSLDVEADATLTFAAGRADELSGSNVTSITGDGNVTVIASASQSVDLSALDHTLGGTFQLTGGSGANSLTGTDGVDRITGGNGIDTFVYTAISQSETGAADTITDFAAATETLVFDNIAEGTLSFLGTETFTSGGGVEARFDDDTSTAQIDVDGNGSADISIVLTGVVAADLSAANFVWQFDIG